MTSEAVHVRHLAMATEFELLLYGERREYLETVGEEVMREIDRIEAQLSFYREESDVRAINASAARFPVPLDGDVCRLLERALWLSELTEGAFDITVAPLMRCWGFVGASGQMPVSESIQSARDRVGMHHIVLDPEAQTVAFDREGVEIELGAIGKGYAVDRVIGMLREFEIEAALFHGGTSTVYALGTPPERDGWQIAIQRPTPPGGTGLLQGREESHLAIVTLRDEALNISAPHGKWFLSQVDGRRYGHVIDPRTGYPTGDTLLAAIIVPSATDGDALSTALLVQGASLLPVLTSHYPHARALVANGREALDVVSAGIPLHPDFHAHS